MSGQYQVEFSADVYAALEARAAEEGKEVSASWIAEQLLGNTGSPEDEVQRLLERVPANIADRPLKEVIGDRIGSISADGPDARDIEGVVGDIIMEKFDQRRP